MGQHLATDAVRKAIERYVEERGENRFTTADIARFLGVEEYPVRAAVSWLARYGMIEIIPGVRSRRYRSTSPPNVAIRRWLCCKQLSTEN